MRGRELLGSVGSLPSQEQWARVRRVLLGEDPGGISVQYAARAAGVTLRELEGWVNRSRQCDEFGDEPWVKEIYELWDRRDKLKEERLEDRLWKRGLQGVVTREKIEQRDADGELVGFTTKAKNDGGDIRALERLLEGCGGKYSRAKEDVRVKVDFDMGELFRRYSAGARLKEVKGSHLIDGESGAVVEDG